MHMHLVCCMLDHLHMSNPAEPWKSTSLGHLCCCAGDQAKQREYLARLMGPPNATWGQILAQVPQNPEVLKQQEVIKSLQNVLQTNVSVCTSLGNPYINQMATMVDSMLQVGWA